MILTFELLQEKDITSLEVIVEGFMRYLSPELYILSVQQPIPIATTISMDMFQLSQIN